MKKIILCVVVLLTVLCGVARADLRRPQFDEHLSSLRDLPLQTRLEECRKMVTLSQNGLRLKEWDAMQCSSILPHQEFLQACKKLKTHCHSRAPYFLRCPSECRSALLKEQQAQTRRKYLVYGLIGLGIFFICGNFF